MKNNTVILCDTHARVPNGLGGFKNISLRDFAREVQRIADGKEDNVVDEQVSLRFPNEMVSARVSRQRVDLLMYFPETRVDLKLHIGSLRTFKDCAFPATIITAAMDYQDTQNRWSMSSTHWFCTDLLLPQIPRYDSALSEGSWDNHVFALPMPNQYGGGRMCTGGNSWRSSYETNWVGMNELYYHVLVGSAFNNDLSICTKTSVNDRAKYFRFLQQCERFPYGIIRNHPGPDLWADYLNKDKV